jgi:drug/metabolite transporter (DMT)-like permease
VFAWMGFTTVALKWISVAEASLLVYTMPIWATLFAWPLAGDRPTARGLFALVLGFAGVAVILGGPAHASAEGQTAGAVLALAAAILFGLGTVLNRAPPMLPPVSLVAWQVGLGCLPMFALGLAFEHPDPGALSATGWLLFAYMTAVPMALCYLAWFAALRALPPASASTGMLMVPIIGVASASAALGEPFGLREAAAMILTLSGVALALFRS